MSDIKKFEANVGRVIIHAPKRGSEARMIVTGITKDYGGRDCYECIDADGEKTRMCFDFVDRFQGRVRWAASGETLAAPDDGQLPDPKSPGYSAAMAKRARGGQSVQDALRTMDLIRSGASDDDIKRASASFSHLANAQTGKRAAGASTRPRVKRPPVITQMALGSVSTRTSRRSSVLSRKHGEESDCPDCIMPIWTADAAAGDDRPFSGSALRRKSG